MERIKAGLKVGGVAGVAIASIAIASLYPGRPNTCAQVGVFLRTDAGSVYAMEEVCGDAPDGGSVTEPGSVLWKVERPARGDQKDGDGKQWKKGEQGAPWPCACAPVCGGGPKCQKRDPENSNRWIEATPGEFLPEGTWREDGGGCIPMPCVQVAGHPSPMDPSCLPDCAVDAGAGKGGGR